MNKHKSYFQGNSNHGEDIHKGVQPVHQLLYFLRLFPLLLSTFMLLFSFNWDIAALQCCVISTVGQKESACMPISSVLNLSHPPHPSSLSSPSAELSSVCYQRIPTSYFTHGSVYMSIPISPVHPTALLNPCAHNSILLYVLLPCK